MPRDLEYAKHKVQKRLVKIATNTCKGNGVQNFFEGELMKTLKTAVALAVVTIFMIIIFRVLGFTIEWPSYVLGLLVGTIIQAISVISNNS